MSCIPDFVNLLKRIASYIGKNELLGVLMFMSTLEVATQMEIEGIKDAEEPMMALLYLLLQKSKDIHNLPMVIRILKVHSPPLPLRHAHTHVV